MEGMGEVDEKELDLIIFEKLFSKCWCKKTSMIKSFSSACACTTLATVKWWTRNAMSCDLLPHCRHVPPVVDDGLLLPGTCHHVFVYVCERARVLCVLVKL